MRQRNSASVFRFERNVWVMLISLIVSTGVSAQTDCPRVDPARNVYPTYVHANAIVALEASSDLDNPLDLVLYLGVESCSRAVVDKYSVEGSAPEITAVFPYSLKGKPSLFVIVSWQINSRGVGTYGTLYQIYAYEEDGAGGLASNQLIGRASQMTGVEGIADGKPSHFDGKTAAEVKQLIDRIHLK